MVIFRNDSVGLATTLHSLVVDRGTSWEEAEAAYQKVCPPGPPINVPAWMFCVSWCADFEFRGAYRKAVAEESEADTEGTDDEEMGIPTGGGSRTGFYRSKKKMFGEHKHMVCRISSRTLQPNPPQNPPQNPSSQPAPTAPLDMRAFGHLQLQLL